MGLWQKMMVVAESAKECGMLHSIENSFEVIEDGGIRFVVRLASGLGKKPKGHSDQPKPKQNTSPFLPPEPELLVSSISDSYNLVLNKFNVLETHALLTTVDFVEQTDLLTLNDFSAVSWALAEADGLVFYNGGKVAGASQPHRHFQLVPKDMGDGELPIEQPILDWHEGKSDRLFPFAHRICWLQDYEPETLLETWRKLEFQFLPYNLLITRQWMLIVPRSQESFEDISVNSLGFAGALLVKTEQELNLLKEHGPMAVLASVSQQGW